MCDLCGTPVEASAPVAPSGTEVVSACVRCGNVPPAGSAFCNRCGAALSTAAPVPPPGERPPSTVGRRAFAVAAVGVGAVVVLYGATLLSRPQDAPEPGGPPEAAVGPAAPIPDGAPALPDTLQAAADRFAAEGTASGWYESGRYYLTAAFNASATDPTASVRWARRAIEDFERSLAIEEAPDVRFALAEAASFDPSNPMRPVQELQAVLSTDPEHVGATYLLGELRLQIGRVDSARVAFERVLALTEPGDPVRQRAEAALQTIRTSGP